ncbi:MAG: aminopeptidase N, partial [Pseudomonadales bacterium]
VLLSNGDRMESGSLQDGRHFAVWCDPHPKPSYIFAVVAGDLRLLRDRYVTGSGREVALAIYAEPQHIDDCGYAMGALKRALAWDEAAYGLEYDLSHYNIVAIDDYTGAMENKGLNLFEAKGIVASPAFSTDNDYLVLERILGHEVFHNWTGNRVTCRDWFELCLKEGLTRFRDRQFSEAMSAPGPKRIDAVSLLRRNQFAEDDGAAAHPVKPTRYADVQNLYTATVYEKGSELIRMLAVLVGQPAFRRALRRFLEQHDGQAVTTEELLAALEAESGHDLAAFRPWYQRAGRPRVQVTTRHDAATGRFELSLQQRVPQPPAEVDPPLLMPVSCALFDARGRPVPMRSADPDVVIDDAGTGVLWLREREQRFVFDGVAAPPVASLFRGLSAPVSVDVTRSDRELAMLAACETDPLARWDAAQQLATAVIRRVSDGLALAEAGVGVYGSMFEALLDDEDTDQALLARLLGVPDEPTLSEGLPRVDVDGHATARRALRAHLAERFLTRLLTRYQALTDDGAYRPEPRDMARRALRNACLDLLLAAPGGEGRRLALAQARSSDNMNDRYAALAGLCHWPCPERDEAVALCLERWRDHPIALGQWLIAQALGTAPDTVDRVMALTAHPDVDVGDPALGMALFGSFFRQNRQAFHHPSGIGYEFLADTLIRVDRVRPSGSFWLMPQISQWRRYDDGRQALMRAALGRVAGTPGISRGLAENVARALGSGSRDD